MHNKFIALKALTSLREASYKGAKHKEVKTADVY